MQGDEQGETGGRQGGHFLKLREAFPEDDVGEGFCSRSMAEQGKRAFCISRQGVWNTTVLWNMGTKVARERSAQGAMVP